MRRLYPDLFGGETPIDDDQDLAQHELELALPIATEHPHRGHLCTVCRINSVTPTDGQDTCEPCAATI